MAATVTYMDHAATTPMRQSAIDAMMPFLDGVYANPSGSHRFARLARKSVDEARDLIASIVGCKPGEVVFTGCGTESDNAAIVGVVRRRGRRRGLHSTRQRRARLAERLARQAARQVVLHHAAAEPAPPAAAASGVGGWGLAARRVGGR